MHHQNMRYLTKSRFKLAVKCPTRLFYAGPGKASIYRNLLSEGDLTEGGFQVGKMATMRYPQGIEAKARLCKSLAPEILGAFRGAVCAMPLYIRGSAKYVSH
jgi:hypothetical protein